MIILNLIFFTYFISLLNLNYILNLHVLIINKINELKKFTSPEIPK